MEVSDRGRPIDQQTGHRKVTLTLNKKFMQPEGKQENVKNGNFIA